MMASDKTYVYCNVLPANYQSPFFYICDFDVKPGDIVVVAIRSDSNEKTGLVLDRNEYTEANAPYPPGKTRHILRPFGDNEPSKLVREKGKIEEEKAIRFKTPEQLEKLSAKEALLKYGVGREKITNSKKKIRELLDSVQDKTKELEDCINDFSGGIQLSSDGKTVTGYRGTASKACIHIPSGVEIIEDDAFERVNIDSLFLPKELKYLGKYTLRGEYGEPKNISSIIVEDGNECFFSDKTGFYTIENGKKKLEFLTDSAITVYNVPGYVSSFAEGSLWNASLLRQIILSEGTEEFDEYALPNDTKVEEVYISKTVKKLRPKNIDKNYEIWNRVSYRIDEENEYLFRDEDSIYEVLDDGTYRLLTNLYTGRGKVLILEGTSIIGKSAFQGHKNFQDIEFPKSLRIIEESAFEDTALKKLVIPDHVVSIGERAFSDCRELKNVTLSPKIDTVASDAFSDCENLQKIKTKGKEKAFTFNRGVIIKISSGKPEGSSSRLTSQYAWMKGKIFVHTGLSKEEGKEFEDIVSENGGDVRSSTVLGTDYLVYNEDYDHETTKLRKARELQDQGKGIQIITYGEWLNTLESGVAPTVGSVCEESEDPEAISKAAFEAAMKKDYFGEFANKVEELLPSYDLHNKTIYDETSRVISIETRFYQQTENPDLVKERVACAEELKKGDPVIIKLNCEGWEVTSKSGKSLGELSWSLADTAFPYLNFITVLEGSVASITPKSMRRADEEYATGLVKFDIKERSVENLSEQDLVTRTQFSYSITDTEAILIKWIADEAIKKAVVPAVIEGKPVKTIPCGVFERDDWLGSGNVLEEIVFSEGIQRIERGALFYLEFAKKVVFPASVNYISPNVFADENGEYKDLYMSSKTVYIAPIGSYAEKFLKDYKPNHNDVDKLTVINDDHENNIV